MLRRCLEYKCCISVVVITTVVEGLTASKLLYLHSHTLGGDCPSHCKPDIPCRPFPSHPAEGTIHLNHRVAGEPPTLATKGEICLKRRSPRAKQSQ